MLLYVDSQYVSPYAMSAFVALHEKRIPFDLRGLDLRQEAHLDYRYVSTSLTARVPMLVDDNFFLSESSAIAEYLDETYPGALLYPEDRRERARARQLQAWLRSDLLALRQERPTESVFIRPNREPLSTAAKLAAKRLISVATTLLQRDANHLFGSWCIADTDLALMLNRLACNGDPLPMALECYARRQWERRSVQKWLSLQRLPVANNQVRPLASEVAPADRKAMTSALSA